mmetsp:Transcript_42565/g.74601  ORF Transcript_42565/g.74601 Transcript_42565/m.74601 type:complete len:234 (-) Transcript_42565:566-1267(-)
MQEPAALLQGCLLVREGILMDHRQQGIIVLNGKKMVIVPHRTIMPVINRHNVTNRYNMVGMIHAVEKKVVVVNRILGGVVNIILDHMMMIGTNMTDVMIGHFPEEMGGIGSINIANMMMVDGGENGIGTGTMIVRVIIHIIDQITLMILALVRGKVVNSLGMTSHDRIILLPTNAKSMAIVTAITTTTATGKVQQEAGIVLVRHTNAKSNQVIKKKYGPYLSMWQGSRRISRI